MNYLYPLSNDTWDTEEQLAIKHVLDTGQFTMGKQVHLFEEEFANYFGSKYAVMSNSGSSANLLAIAALIYSGRLLTGDEVLVPAVSWSTTFFPLSQYGLKLRFIDIDPLTLNMDLTHLEQSLTPKTKAIFSVNLLGNPNNFDKLMAFCKSNNLILLEDNCESMGATYGDRCAGTFGLMGTFSTFFSHHICTMEGGMTITDDEELYQYLLAIRAHGWTRNLPKENIICKKAEDEFYESFRFVVPGYNLRPIEIEASIGREQLKKLNLFLTKRRDNASLISKFFADIPDIVLQRETSGGLSSWFGFAVTLTANLKGKRESLLHELKDNKIETRPVVAGNFLRQQALNYMDYSVAGSTKHADYLHDNSFFVGNHSIEMQDQLLLFRDTIVKFINK